MFKNTVRTTIKIGLNMPVIDKKKKISVALVITHDTGLCGFVIPPTYPWKGTTKQGNLTPTKAAIFAQVEGQYGYFAYNYVN